MPGQACCKNDITATPNYTIDLSKMASPEDAKIFRSTSRSFVDCGHTGHTTKETTMVYNNKSGNTTKRCIPLSGHGKNSRGGDCDSKVSIEGKNQFLEFEQSGTIIINEEIDPVNNSNAINLTDPDVNASMNDVSSNLGKVYNTFMNKICKLILYDSLAR